ncbi:ribonuclease H-like domain-containing protein [Tanacetum coccineum]
MAPMALSDSKVKTCLKTCLKNHETLKTQYDKLRIEHNKTEFDLANYKRALASVEEQLAFYKNNEVIFTNKIAVLKRDASFNEAEIIALKTYIEKLKKDKEMYRSQRPRENQRNWNNKKSQQPGSDFVMIKKAAIILDVFVADSQDIVNTAIPKAVVNIGVRDMIMLMQEEDLGLGSTSGIRACALRNFDLEDIIKKNSILIRKRWCFQTQRHILIKEENGITVTNMSAPATAKEKTNKKNDVKARGLLLMALPNEHQLTFSQYPDAKSIAASPSVNIVSPQVCTESVSDNTVMRAKKYYQKTGKKIFINGNDIAGYDKSKVECYTCHKLGHFARECRAPRSKEGQFRNQDNTRKQGNNEDTSKAMLAIDGLGRIKSSFGEEACCCHFKREVGCKQYEINMLKTEFEKVKQEKEGIDFKIEKFENASKDLDKLLGSQITDNSKKGLGYHAVPPPHPLIYNAPTKLDLSYSRLDEFKEPEFEGYGLRANKSVCKISSNETKKNSDAPLIEEWVSDNEDEVESPIIVEKKIVVPTIPKVDVVRPKQQEKLVRKTVSFDHLQYTCKQKRQLNGQREEKPDKVILMLFVVVAQDKLILLDKRQWLMLLGRIGLMLLKHQHVGFGRTCPNLIVLIHFDGDMITVVQEGRSKFEMAWVPKQERLGYKAAVKLHDQFDDEKRAGAELTQQNDKWGGGGVNSTELHGKLMLIEKITSEVNAD